MDLGGPGERYSTSLQLPLASLMPYDRAKSYISLQPRPTPHPLPLPHISTAAFDHDQPKTYSLLPFGVLGGGGGSGDEPENHLSESYQPRLDVYLEQLPPPGPEPALAAPQLPPAPKRRGRKPKNGGAPSRHENKTNRNSNKPYVNYKGVEIEPRKFDDFWCACSKKCGRRLSAADRAGEFDKFWALSAYDAQTAYIAAKVAEHPVKRRYGKSDRIKKDFSRTYSLCSTAVCRDMFCRTLQISSGRINTALTKIRTRTTIKDQRGIRKLPASKVTNRRTSEFRSLEKNPENIVNFTENTEHFVLCEKSPHKENHCQKEVHLNTPQGFRNDTCTEKSGYMILDSANPSSDVLSNEHMPTITTSIYRTFVETTATQPLRVEATSTPMDMCSVLFTETKDNLPSNAMRLTTPPPPVNAERPKKGRKPKFNQSRQENKVNRNNNKAYINYKGILVEPKKFNDYKCDCSKKCYLSLCTKYRFSEFEKFWALHYDSQTAYIVAAVSEQPVKRRYTQENETKKDFTRKYALGSIAVCREMFCRTLHISPGRINTALKKYRLRSALTDQRGIKQGGHNRLPAEKRNCVVRFIKRIPVYKSHYCKEKSKSRFLPPEMTLAKLYELYKEEEKDNAVSNASFKKIFYNSFNLRTKESCYQCETLNNQLRKEQNSLKKLQLKQKYDEHRAMAEKAQKYLEHDMLLAKKYTEVECVTFDMERTLPLPRIPANMMCYKRLLWLYNTGIHSCKKDQSYCYVWPEGQAGKGTQEVGSCLLKHAKEEIIWSPDLCHLILWTDSCGGLNRNIKLTLMLKSLLQSCPTLKTIKLKFLVSGHSSLPNQRDFGDIERTLKNHSHLYTPDDYMNLMRYCRKKKPLIVKSMTNQEFLSTEQLEKHIMNSKISTEKDKITWSEVCEISMFVHDPYTIYFKTDFEGENVSLDFRPRPDGQQLVNFMHLLVPLWPLGKPITPAKLKDLKSMLHLIPTHAKNFYSNLQCGSNNDEDVDGFNEELDFDVEYIHK